MSEHHRDFEARVAAIRADLEEIERSLVLVHLRPLPPMNLRDRLFTDENDGLADGSP